MNHIEYIEKLLAEMLKDFIDDPAATEEIEIFRKGVKFGMKYVIASLKNPREDLLNGD